MNETLRLYSVLPFLPKKTGAESKTLTINGQEYNVPPDTLIMINTSAVHRNPQHWPKVLKKKSDGPPFPVSSFEPDHWLGLDNIGGYSEKVPDPGTYIPYSEGYRSCMGRRFAQVEFCVVVAKVFREYSVELALDDRREGPSSNHNEIPWEEAKARAEHQLSDGVGFVMALKMTSPVPLRFVKRR